LELSIAAAGIPGQQLRLLVRQTITLNAALKEYAPLFA
jgi:hypothetical protein